MILNTEYSNEEKEIITLCSGGKFEILESIEKECYILNAYGKILYQDCFGETKDEYIRHQRYNIAKPRRIIKFYQYYLMEDESNIGEWFVGTKQNNGALEFLSCCEDLQYAFESL